jgi:tight adherence protein C
MANLPIVFVLGVAIGAFGLSVFALRGLLDIRDALRHGELGRLAAPIHWSITRAWLGLAAGMPMVLTASRLGAAAWVAGATVAALGFWAAPQFLAAERQRVMHEMHDDLALHLDLIALAMEAGSSLPAALGICAQHAPAGALRRAWVRVLVEIHAGADPLEALRGLEQRSGLAALASLIAALRSAQRFNIAPAQVLRDRARQSAGQRFARAEREARAAPLKLWAALVLAVAPCTVVVLAFPMARMLAMIADR